MIGRAGRYFSFSFSSTSKIDKSISQKFRTCYCLIASQIKLTGLMENTLDSVWKPSVLVILHTIPTSPRGPSNPERQVPTFVLMSPIQHFLFLSLQVYKHSTSYQFYTL